MNKYFFFIMMLLIGFAPKIMAQNEIGIEEFSKLPIMHDGRIKPIDSFARAQLKTFSGSEKNAVPWFIETIFNPASSENIRVIKIINQEVLASLSLEKRKEKLYSYKEVSGALALHQDLVLSAIKAPEESWTQAQRNLIALQEKVVLMADLLASTSLFLPLSVELPNNVPDDLKPYANQKLSYLDVTKFQEALDKNVKSIIAEHGSNIENYTPLQQDLAFLAFTYKNLQATGQQSKQLKVISTNAPSAWLSPWEAILGKGNPQTASLFQNWSDLTQAYYDQDTQKWGQAIQAIKEKTQSSDQDRIRPAALNMEYIYNAIAPFKIASWLYGITLLMLMIAAIFKKQIFGAAMLTALIGFLFELCGICMRIYIMQRPPVSTLYESILFCGAVCALVGIIFAYKNKSQSWIALGAGAAFMLSLVSLSHNQDGDSMLMLTAVLNTNFWLATHVICITLGYAFCMITSMLAHYQLLAPDQNRQKELLSLALIALLFAAVGTVLGGIWADQSWGRFWGWDPKENGALLIVLWLLWILHGRISGQMKQLFVNAALAYLSVIVALSWFGVNLLSVGLHAYGFTDSAAYSLALFTGVETLLIGALYVRGRKRIFNAG